MEKQISKAHQQDYWTDYIHEYRKNNPEKVKLWNAKSQARAVCRYMNAHPEHAEELRKLVLGE